METDDAILERLIRSWRLSSEHHELNGGASDRQIDAFERAAGWSLPADCRTVYRFTNGAELVDANVNLYALTGGERSVLHASDALRSWGWPVPEELHVIGDNGGDEILGVWIPLAKDTRSAIVEIGEIFEPNCLAIASTSLLRLLLARTSYYLLLCEAPAEAVAALAPPSHIASMPVEQLGDPEWLELLNWADSDRPQSPDSSYDARLDARTVNELLRTTANRG